MRSTFSFLALFIGLGSAPAFPCAELLVPVEVPPDRISYTAENGVLQIHDNRWGGIPVMEVRFAARRFSYAGPTAAVERAFARRGELNFRLRGAQPALANVLLDEARVFLQSFADSHHPGRFLTGAFFATCDYRHLVFQALGGFVVISRENPAAVEWVPVPWPKEPPEAKWASRDVLFRLVGDHLRAFFDADPRANDADY